MKVKCVKLSASKEQLEWFGKDPYSKNNYSYFLTIGKEYLVFAADICFEIQNNNLIGGYTDIFIRNDDGLPLYVPIFLFEITDPQVSKYWVYSIWKRGNVRGMSLQPPLMKVIDTWKLADGEYDETENFRKLQALLEAESQGNKIYNEKYERTYYVDYDTVICVDKNNKEIFRKTFYDNVGISQILLTPKNNILLLLDGMRLSKVINSSYKIENVLLIDFNGNLLWVAENPEQSKSKWYELIGIMHDGAFHGIIAWASSWKYRLDEATGKIIGRYEVKNLVDDIFVNSHPVPATHI